jgi:hypothetical protein
MRLLGRDRATIGVGDALVDRQGRRLGAAGQLGGRLGIERPGVEQVQVEGDPGGAARSSASGRLARISAVKRAMS